MDKLDQRFELLPDWIKHAYHHDMTVHRIVEEWRMSSEPVFILYHELARGMYEMKNYWQGTAENSYKFATHPIQIIQATKETQTPPLQ